MVKMSSSLTTSQLQTMQKSFSMIEKSQKNIFLTSKKTSEVFNRQKNDFNTMQKSMKSVASSMRLVALTLGALAINKTFQGIKNAISSYGSTGARFNATANKSNALDIKAMQRALELNTGSTQEGLLNSLGKIASNAMINGSDEQRLLSQSGINPLEFQRMNELERLETILDIFKDKGAIKPFRDLIESITGLDGNQLEALLSKREGIKKDFNSEKKNLKEIMGSNDFEKLGREWDKLKYSISDLTASLLSNLTPLIIPIIESLKSFASGGGIEKVISIFQELQNSSFIKAITDGSEVIRNAIKSILSPEIVDTLKNIAENGAKIFKRIAELLSEFLVPVLKRALPYIVGFIDGLQKVILSLLNMDISKVKDFFNMIKNGFVSFFEAGVNKIIELKNKITYYINEVIFSFKSMLINMRLFILDKLNIAGVFDSKVDSAKKDLFELEKEREANKALLAPVITIENQILTSDINQQVKTQTKAFQ